MQKLMKAKEQFEESMFRNDLICVLISWNLFAMVKRLTRKRYKQIIDFYRRWEIESKLYIGIFATFAISFYIIRNLPPAVPHSSSIQSLSKITPPLDVDQKEYYNMLINSTRFAYTNFIENCLGHDEYRPNTGKCLDSYGFNATIIESVETLYLLQQYDLYEHAYNFIKENFSCHNIGWVNRREMFSRLVSSFIGSYLLTGDKMFLHNAEECTNLAIAIDDKFKYPKPYHNYINNSYKKRMWINGTALQDVSPGLPEIVALYHITENPVYLNYYTKIAKNLPRKRGVFYYSILTIPRGMNGTVMQQMDGFTVGFYYNLAIAHGLHPIEPAGFALNKTAAITRLDYRTDFALLPLANAVSHVAGTKAQFMFSGVDKLVQEANKRYENCSNLFDSNGFRFDGSYFEVMLRRGTQNENILRCIDYVVNRTKREKGFSGTRMRRGIVEEKDDDVQPSHFIGQFLKAGALALTKDNFGKDVILNERGHILSIPKIRKFPTDTSPDPCSRVETHAYDLFCK